VTPPLEVTAPVVLAHGGGLPEAAAIGLPLLALVLFAVLERRARRRERGEEDGG
jgi:hypothetical protein